MKFTHISSKKTAQVIISVLTLHYFQLSNISHYLHHNKNAMTRCSCSFIPPDLFAKYYLVFFFFLTHILEATEDDMQDLACVVFWLSFWQFLCRRFIVSESQNTLRHLCKRWDGSVTKNLVKMSASILSWWTFERGAAELTMIFWVQSALIIPQRYFNTKQPLSIKIPRLKCGMILSYFFLPNWFHFSTEFIRFCIKNKKGMISKEPFTYYLPNRPFGFEILWLKASYSLMKVSH